MAWPPPVLPINRTNATPSQDTHPQDHNAVNLAVNDLVVKVGEADNRIRSSYISRTVFTSGAIGATAVVVLTLSGVDLRAAPSRYDVRMSLFVLADIADSGAVVRLLANGAVVTAVDVPLPKAGVPALVESTVIYTPAAAGLVTFTVDVAKAWWSANPVKAMSGANNPAQLQAILTGYWT
jgi:hypothetical protein